MISDMKHPSAERLEAFAESTLPAGDRVVIESHVLGCPDCQTSVEEWRSPGFAERVMAGVHLAPARRRARGWSWQSAQAAVVAWGEETARAASRFLPRTTFGWAMATAFLSLPFVLVAAVMGWLVSKSYLTPQSLWAFASEQAAVGLRSLGETAVTTALQTNMAGWVVAQAVAFMERAGLPGVGVMLASAGLATVLSAWVLYRNLFRTPARDTNYASYSF
jgi:hypothetical protein